MESCMRSRCTFLRDCVLDGGWLTTSVRDSGRSGGQGSQRRRRNTQKDWLDAGAAERRDFVCYARLFAPEVNREPDPGEVQADVAHGDDAVVAIAEQYILR